VVSAGGRLAAVSYQPGVRSTSFSVSLFTPSGRLAAPARVTTPDVYEGQAVVAASPRGAEAVVWTRDDKISTRHLLLALRSPGGRFSSAISLTSTTAYAYTSSIDAKGRWVVGAAVRIRNDTRLIAWTGVIGHRARHRIDLGVAPYLSVPTATIDGAGRTFVLWRSQVPVGEFYAGPIPVPWHVRAATIDPSGIHATAAQTIANGAGAGGELVLAASPVGGATLAISDDSPADDPYYDNTTPGADGGTRVSSATAGGAFGPLSAVLPHSTATTYAGSPRALAYRPDGTALAIWSDPMADHTYAAAVVDGQGGEPEDTGLPAAEGNVLVGPTTSGEPRLFVTHGRGKTAHLLWATRIAP
jgi:hypothetical protein